MDKQWQIFFEKFPGTVTEEQLPVKLPRFDLDLSDLAGAAADWCHQYLKDRKCPNDLIVFLIKKIINNLRVKWAAEPKLFGYRPEKEDYQALWFMQRVIEELKEVCFDYGSSISYNHSLLTQVWWSSFVLKNSRRQMEDYIAVVPYLHTLFDVKNYGEASFYAVYDGHNGLDSAMYSSMYLHHYLVQSTYYPTNPEHALYEAIYSTDKGFTQKTEKYNLVSGTTAVCALHRPQEKKLYVAWVGDSIATLWKNGTPLCLVNKHVPERNDEMQRIENEGGIVSKCRGVWRVDGQLAVSRAIGDVKYKPHITCQPEIRSLVLDGNEEFLVLCSDGLWNHIAPEDVAETIYDELLESDGNVSEVGNKLAFKSKSQGSTDNISVITVFLQDPKLLVARRRAVNMETAMEQRNVTATLASYGQDTTGDFGPETDVDTPDDPIGSSKPKVEGESNVIDESGEDSEEDGGGWNYYKKSMDDTEKKANQDIDNKLDHNSDTEDMDYKLNPDAPEFIPVSTPPLPTENLAQRLIEMDNDDFISSSPQKFKESLDNLDVPDENDFTNDIKVHAADLSKLDNTHEPSDDYTALNGFEPLKEEVISHVEKVDNLMHTNEHIDYENENASRNPFASDTNVDLNKVQDLSECLNDDSQTHNIDPYVSIMETPKINEFNTSNDNVLQNELNTQLNNDFSAEEHVKYEQDMSSKNIDDPLITTNATIGSALQLNDESFKYSDECKNDIVEGSLTDKFGQYEDGKFNDSVSTTDAILGSEPNTPMRMENQTTFESESDDDQFSESFKQQLQLNKFDVHNDKENYDPFCFTDDPAGIIPNVIQEVNEIDKTHQIDESGKLNDRSSSEHQASELKQHKPVEEPLCLKEEAKPFHSVYEQQDLPESDFSISTHEALLNVTESELNHSDYSSNSINPEFVEQKDHVENKLGNIENTKVEHLQQKPLVPSYTADDVELDDSDEDEIKNHIGGLNQEYFHDNSGNFEQDVNKCSQDYQDSDQGHFDAATIQYNTEGIEQEYHNSVSGNITNNIEDVKENNQFCKEVVQNHVEDIVETVQSQVEDFEQECHNVLPVGNSYVDDLKLDNDAETKNNCRENIKEEIENFTETSVIYNPNFQQEHHDTESIQNQVADSDEEMHSSMIIHADVENNMPQPYCSTHETLVNEPGMMSTSMTFEENFQNRNMSDSLYVMETSSDYFGEEIQQSKPLDNLVNEAEIEDHDLLNADNIPVEPITQNKNEIVTEEKSKLVSEPSVEVKTESSQFVSQSFAGRVDKPEENNMVSEIAVAAAAGTAAVAAVTGVALASKKSAPKKLETTVSKAKTTSTKTTLTTKPLASKPTSNIKKAPLSTASKSLSRPTTAPSSSKPTSNVRPATVPKTTSNPKTTSVTKAAPKPASKITAISSRTTSAKTTSTTPRVSLTKTTPTSPKTPTTSKTAVATKSPTTKTSTTPRTSPVIKQSLNSTSPKPLTRPTSAPAKKPFSSATTNDSTKLTNGTTKLNSKLTNGTAKLTNGDVSKTLTTTKPPVSLATRMSLAPPKLPPKAKVAPKTVAPPPMPGPIRRPKAPTTKKTETATS